MNDHNSLYSISTITHTSMSKPHLLCYTASKRKPNGGSETTFSLLPLLALGRHLPPVSGGSPEPPPCPALQRSLRPEHGRERGLAGDRAGPSRGAEGSNRGPKRYASVSGLQCLVPWRHSQRRARRLRSGSRHHGYSSLRLRHLGSNSGCFLFIFYFLVLYIVFDKWFRLV